MTLPPPPPPPMPSQERYNPHELEANGRYGGKTAPPFLILLLNVINTMTELLLGAVALSAFSTANLYGNWKAIPQHVYLCVIGYVILMSQAIMSMNPHVGWAYSLKYQDKKVVHGVLQILGAALAICGSIVIIVDSDVHFNSAHGVTGIIAMILTFFSLIGGVLNFIIPLQTSSFLYKVFHMCIGCLTISVAFICLCLGFDHWYNVIFSPINVNISICLTVFALGGVLTSAVTRTVKKVVSNNDW